MHASISKRSFLIVPLPAFSFTATHSLPPSLKVPSCAALHRNLTKSPSSASVRPSRHSCRSRLFARGGAGEGGGVFTEIWKGTREQNSVQRSGELYCSMSSELQNSHESAPRFLHRSSLIPVKSLLVGIPPLLHMGLTIHFPRPLLFLPSNSFSFVSGIPSNPPSLNASMVPRLNTSF